MQLHRFRHFAAPCIDQQEPLIHAIWETQNNRRRHDNAKANLPYRNMCTRSSPSRFLSGHKTRWSSRAPLHPLRLPQGAPARTATPMSSTEMMINYNIRCPLNSGMHSNRRTRSRVVTMISDRRQL